MFAGPLGAEAVELADVVVGGELHVADVKQDARRRNAVLAQRPLGELQLAGQFWDAASAKDTNVP